MIKKIFTATIICLFCSLNAFSAGSGGDGGSSKTKTNYEKAVSYIKSAKKLEKKGKLEKAKKHVLNMVKNQALNCHSGKQIPCEIDSVCIHGDNESSLATAKSIKDNLLNNGLKLKALNTMKKFI